MEPQDRTAEQGETLRYSLDELVVDSSLEIADLKVSVTSANEEVSATEGAAQPLPSRCG